MKEQIARGLVDPEVLEHKVVLLSFAPSISNLHQRKMVLLLFGRHLTVLVNLTPKLVPNLTSTFLFSNFVTICLASSEKTAEKLRGPVKVLLYIVCTS